MTTPPVRAEQKPLLYRQLAALVATGATQEQMATETGLTVPQVRTLLKAEECKAVVERLAEEHLKVAVDRVRRKASGLVELAMKALEMKLREGNMEAVRTTLRILGVEQAEQQATPDTTINVLLPGQTRVEPTTIVIPQSTEEYSNER